MKRYSSSIIQTIAIGGLNIGVLIYATYLLLILLYGFFDIKPFHNFHDGGGFGLTDFENGIPVNVKFNEELPYMDISAKDSKGKGIQYKIWNSSRDLANKVFIDSNLVANTISADTISTRFTLPDANAIPGHNLMITGARLDKGMINVQTKNIGLKFLLLLPQLLGAIIIVCCIWQISGLLRNILEGKAFHKSNLTRLQNVGVLIIAYQLFLFFLPLLCHFNIIIDFSSSAPNFRTPVSLNASTDYDFSTTWLIIGFSMLIISSAFKKGAQLQEEQELFV